jgi:phosphoenolpyruvate carboxykinase (ATP)
MSKTTQSTREWTRAELIEETLRLGAGRLSQTGALIVETGKWTGRATKEKFLVRREETEKTVNWGAVNQPLAKDVAHDMFDRLRGYLAQQRTYNTERYIGGFRIEMASTSPWHVLFAQNMFRASPVPGMPSDNRPIEILHAPYLNLKELGSRAPGETIICLDVIERVIAIVGTAYAGECKKSAFSIANYLLPEHGVLPMHASANCRADGTSSALMFGLSGTGKTTLSAHPDRWLIGDDEITWDNSGLSNLENGCYAKLIDLDPTREPEIFQATNQFGAIMENVEYSEQRLVDYTGRSRTENTRGSYPIDFLAKTYDQSHVASHPKTIVFLTADAFGALPSVARLNNEQAQFHFLSGYTAKVAGTELGVSQPTAVFSTCFGAPFMPRHPGDYAKLLSEKIDRHNATVWLLNTGWMGEASKGAKRFPLSVSRGLLDAILSGELNDVAMNRHPIFGFDVPKSARSIESKYFNVPEGAAVQDLGRKFRANFEPFKASAGMRILDMGGPIIQ